MFNSKTEIYSNSKYSADCASNSGSDYKSNTKLHTFDLNYIPNQLYIKQNMVCVDCGKSKEQLKQEFSEDQFKMTKKELGEKYKYDEITDFDTIEYDDNCRICPHSYMCAICVNRMSYEDVNCRYYYGYCIYCIIDGNYWDEEWDSWAEIVGRGFSVAHMGALDFIKNGIPYQADTTRSKLDLNLSNYSVNAFRNAYLSGFNIARKMNGQYNNEFCIYLK